MYGKGNMETYIAICKIDSQWGFAVWLRKLKQGLCINLEGSFSYLEPVCCSMSSSNCCLLTCIQVSQEAGHVVWHSRLFQNFPRFIVIHTVNKAEIDVLLELSCFFHDPADVGNLISGSLPFLKSA